MPVVKPVAAVGAPTAAVATAKLPADAVLLGYSGGKDSLALLDLCVRAGARVEAFFMYFLPGLDYTEYWCEFARNRWGVAVRQYQHWSTTYYLRRGVFRQAVDVPSLSIQDIEFCARKDAGVEWIGYGYKKIDSLERRAFLGRDWPGGVNASAKKFTLLSEWNNTDVRSYLSRRRIPIPESDGRRSSGICLTPECLAWLRAEWPDDYRRILKTFPFAAAQADRADGIKQRPWQRWQLLHFLQQLERPAMPAGWLWRSQSKLSHAKTRHD